MTSSNNTLRHYYVPIVSQSNSADSFAAALDGDSSYFYVFGTFLGWLSSVTSSRVSSSVYAFSSTTNFLPRPSPFKKK